VLPFAVGKKLIGNEAKEQIIQPTQKGDEIRSQINRGEDIDQGNPE
jgi:hypothetical protein